MSISGAFLYLLMSVWLAMHASIAAHSPLNRRDVRIWKPPPTGCHTTDARASASAKLRSAICGSVVRRAEQNSISCNPQPLTTHRIGLRDEPAGARRQGGIESGSKGIAPHVAWQRTGESAVSRRVSKHGKCVQK